MCLASPYSDGLADALIRVARETGARHLKWDAIGQYGCDSPHHWHGNESNTEEERWNSYAFEVPLQMARIVEKVSAAIPDLIVDFDITEGGRAVGLSFLSVGKYFLINNGPYKFNYDVPMDLEHENWNLFFYPGPARTWTCRSPLTYDKWIPSILFLTHYLPDDPASSQLVNVALFAQERGLATIVGMSTPGRLVSHRGFNIGHGFTLVVPTGAYVSWDGNHLDGSGIRPDVSVDWSRDAVLKSGDLQLQAARHTLTETFPVARNA